MGCLKKANKKVLTTYCLLVWFWSSSWFWSPINYIYDQNVASRDNLEPRLPIDSGNNASEVCDTNQNQWLFFLPPRILLRCTHVALFYDHEQRWDSALIMFWIFLLSIEPWRSLLIGWIWNFCGHRNEIGRRSLEITCTGGGISEWDHRACPS